MMSITLQYRKLHLYFLLSLLSLITVANAGGAELAVPRINPGVTMTRLLPVGPPAVRYSGILNGQYVYLTEGGTLYHVCVRSPESTTGTCADLTVGDTLDAPAARVDGKIINVQLMPAINEHAQPGLITSASLSPQLHQLSQGPAGLHTANQRWHITDDRKDVLMYNDYSSKGTIRSDLGLGTLSYRINFVGVIGQTPFSLTGGGLLTIQGRHLKISPDHVDRVAWDRSDLALLSSDKLRTFHWGNGQLTPTGVWNVPEAGTLCFTPRHVIFTSRQGVSVMMRGKQNSPILVSSHSGDVTCSAEAEQFILFQSNEDSWVINFQ